ncbi:MAG: hypothetical protein PVJ29_06930 [Desulfobacterales bacterium]|jgi:hypothetical protein
MPTTRQMMQIPGVKTELSAQYVDHNLLQGSLITVIRKKSG